MNVTNSLETEAALGQNEHPLLVFAAGWIAAERALERPYRGENNFPLRHRLNSLAQAHGHWQRAADGLQELRAGPDDLRLRNGLNLLGAQLQEVFTYSPMMEVCAARLAGRPPENSAFRENLKQTRLQSRLLARYLLDIPADGEGMRRTRDEIQARALCGLIGNLAMPGKYLILPASIRQRNRTDRDRAANYVAHSADPPYPRTLLYATLQYDPTASGECSLSVGSMQELTLSQGDGVTGTLSAIAALSSDRMPRVMGRQVQDAYDRLTERLDKYAALTRRPVAGSTKGSGRRRK